MATSIIRVQENERVDLEDFEFAAGESVVESGRQVVDQLLTKPGVQQSWIVRGFAITNPAGSQLQVTRGAAILPCRVGAQIRQAYITAEGEALRILDLTGFAAGTYGIYIKFDHVAAENGSRIFWNPAGAGTEYTQVIATRYKADWSLRVEVLDPGGEWFKIGEVVLPAMTITDDRNFYFEGRVATSYSPTWGSGTDRNSDRALYGIQDFRTFCDMVRKTFQEVKGGATKWWEAGFDQCSWRTGINVGFEAAAAPDTAAVGDPNFCMKFSTGYGDLQGDGDNNKLRYDRANFTWAFHVYDGVSALLEVLNVGRNRVRHQYTGDTFKQLFTSEGDSFSGWVEYYSNGTASRMKFQAAGQTQFELGQYAIYGHRNMNFDRGYGTTYGNELGAFEFSVHCDYTSGNPLLDWAPSYDYTRWDKTNKLLETFVWGVGSSVRRWAAGKDGTSGGKEGLADATGTMQWLNGEDFYHLKQWVDGNHESWVVNGLAVSYVRNDGINNPGRKIKINRGVGFANGKKIELTAAGLVDVTSAANWLSGGAPSGNRWCWAFCRPGLAYCMLSMYPPEFGHLAAAETPEGSYAREDYVFVGSFYYRYVSAGTQYILPFARSGDIVFIDDHLGGALADHVIEDTDLTAANPDVDVSNYVPHSTTAPYTSAIGIVLNLGQVLVGGSAALSNFQVHHGKHDGTLDTPVAGYCDVEGVATATIRESSGQVQVMIERATHDLWIHYHRSAVTATSRSLQGRMAGYIEPLNRKCHEMSPS
jgi:hypothetical protein